jgi:hypothetical protein
MQVLGVRTPAEFFEMVRRYASTELQFGMLRG